MRLNIHPFKDDAEAKAWASATIDTVAAEVRSMYITAIDGQSTAYAAKYSEANAWVNRVTTNPNDCLWLKYDAEAHNRSMDDSALVIKKKGDAWSVIAPQIEAIRVSGKLGLVGLQMKDMVELCRKTVDDLRKFTP